MFAVIKTGGKQYRAKEGDVLEIEKLQVEQGKKVTFDEILLVEDNGKVMIGQPHVADAAVTAVVLENFKDDKIIVFKKKRRQNYRRKAGHRQDLTALKITDIVTGGKKKVAKATEPKAEEKKVAPKAEVQKSAPKAEAKVAPKAEAKAAPKKAEAKPAAPKAEAKPAAKKAPAKKAEAKASAKPAAEKKPAAKKAPAKKPAAKKKD